MNNSIFLFKLKRFFESITEFFTDVSQATSNFFKKILYHPKTEQAGVKIRKAKNFVINNIKENKDNWKRRTFDNHEFRIEEEDI